MADKRGGKLPPYLTYGLGLNLDYSVLKQPRMLTGHHNRRITGVLLGEDANADLKAMGWGGMMDADIWKFKIII